MLKTHGCVYSSNTYTRAISWKIYEERQFGECNTHRERIETESNLPNRFVRMDGIIGARRGGKYSKLFRSQKERKL